MINQPDSVDAHERPGGVMSYKAQFRVWRGDAEGGELADYTVEVNEGEVVLDIIHRLQATQSGDLAVRWNCKAGKCGSCSAEINGRPRLMCMTRMSTFEETETITVTPLRAFPVIKDLVTDVSYNYVKAREIPAFAPPPGLAPGAVSDGPGRRRALPGVPQVHRVLPVPEHLPRDPRSRRQQEGVRRSALPHADRRAGHAPARRGRPAEPGPGRIRPGLTATSPSAAPRSARNTSRSPTTP